MKNIAFWAFSILSIALIGSVVTIINNVKMTDKEIGLIASNYIEANPQVLVKASENLKKQAMKEQNSERLVKVKANISKLLDGNIPYFGNPDGDVTVIEFFDYQCIFCSRISPVLDQLEKDDPGLKFVKFETPIFGSQWDMSNFAARVGLYIFKNKGTEAYETYHKTVFKTGHIESHLQKEDVVRAAKEAGVTQIDIGKDIKNEVNGNLKLFSKLGFLGTPGIIIIPSSGNVDEKVTIVDGANITAIKEGIEKARN